MPRLSLAVAAIALGTAAPAVADTTITQTVTAGGTFRSAEGSPTTENPLIISGTIAPCTSSPGSQGRDCPSGPMTLTITIHGDAAKGLDEENFEGDSSELAPAGPVVDLSLAGAANSYGERATGVQSVTFDVDRSLLFPGFQGLGGTKVQLGSLVGSYGQTPKPGMYSEPFGCNIGGCEPGTAATNEKLDGGDLRVTRNAAVSLNDGGNPVSRGGVTFWEGDTSFLPVQPWAVAKLPGFFSIRAELSDALRHGVLVGARSYYKCDLDIKLTVSSAVAKQLKLKSTTIGEDEIGPRCEGRVPIKAAVKRKLRRYSKVIGKVTVVSHNADGTKTTSSARLELERKRPESELQ